MKTTPWLAVVLLCGSLAAPQAAEREALTIPGKHSLNQRVLTRPGAVARSRAGEPPPPEGALPPLSVFYVFARQDIGGREWLEIGSARKGDTLGWLPASDAIPWRQTLTMAFRRAGGREPVLFFKDRAALKEVLESENLADRVSELRRGAAAAVATGAGYDTEVIALEPDTYIDPNEQFYLIPILDHELVYLESGHEATLLDVAAVTLGGDATKGGIGNLTPARELSGYRAAVVFVIDTTSSMGPYIERTRRAVERVFRHLKDSALGDRLSFGLVAFRDNLQGSPGLGYVSQVVATLDDGRDPRRFLSRVKSVVPATVSSKGFVEDAFAGVYDAIERIDWSGYAGRYLVLITDAGARDAKDPLSRDRLGPERLRLLAAEKDQGPDGGKIAIATLHLLTPAGRASEARAAAQYRELSRWDGHDSLYFPIEDGSPEAYTEVVDHLADLLLGQLEGAVQGKLAETRHVGAGSADLQARARHATALIGRAMQLAYLGRLRGSRAPDLIEASILDRDPIQQDRSVVEVRMLISKNQLSDLQTTLGTILTAGEQTFMNPKDFFAQLRGAAAALARDPHRVNETGVKRLADLGQVAEWLDDLPYTSQVMNLTEEQWLSRTYAQQIEVLDVIEEKIRLYSNIHDDSDRWIPLDPERPLGEAVTTIPLDAMP